MLEPKRAERLLDRAEELYRAGNFAEPRSLAHRVLAEVIESGTGAASAARARAYMILGAVHQDLGETEAALQAYRAGELEILGQTTQKLLLGKIQLCLLQLCVPLGLAEEATRYSREARSNLTGTELEAVVAQIGFWDEVDAETDWREQVRLCRARLSALRAEQQTARRSWTSRARQRDRESDDGAGFEMDLQRKIAELHVAHGDDVEAEDGFLWLGALALTGLEEVHDLREFYTLTNVMGYVRERPAVDIRDLLQQLSAAAASAARRAGSSEMMGQAHYLAGLLHLQCGNPRAALGDTLSSIALAVDGLTRTRSVFLRERYKQLLDERRDFALTLAIQMGDARTAAELIESQRLQTLPLQAARPSEEDLTSDVDAILFGSTAQLGALTQVSVAGVSQLYGRASEYFPVSRNVVPLEAVVSSVGGPSAWWWGVFAALRRVHWVIGAPGGRWWCGTVDFSGADAAFLGQVAEVLDDPGGSGAGAWSTPTAEQQFAARLGRILLPEVLRDQLVREAETSLVLCGNMLAWLPVASMGVDAAGEVRVVERAVLRVQPPAVLVAKVGFSGAQNAASYPLLMSCTDPDGSLQNARHDRLAPLIALVHRSVTERPAGQATRANLEKAIRRFVPSQPGIFFYSGHVASEDVDGGMETVLVLQDGDRVSARDWLIGPPGGSPLPSPSRVVLSACNSAGSAGAGSGEWLGMSAALLSAGARQIIATAWPIIDAPFTKRFEAAVVDELERSDDPARTLGSLQRQALDEWRRGDTSIRKAPYPIIWAAFHCIGMRR